MTGGRGGVRELDIEQAAVMQYTGTAMRKLVSAVGWLLLALGGVWLFFTVVFVLSMLAGAEEEPDPALGGIILAALFGIPGAVIRWRVGLAVKRETFEAEFRGYLMSLDAFTPAELAAKIGRSEMETSGLVARAIDEHGLDLVFHRKTGQYLHRNRIRRTHQVIDRCHACGAAAGHEIVFAGELVNCKYCGTALATA